MKTKTLITIVAASLLTLTGCSTSSADYGEFSLIKDSESAENVFNNFKTKNAQTRDVDEIDMTGTVDGSYVDNNGDTIPINTEVFMKYGVDGTKYASDLIITNDNGTYESFTRFDETTNKYYNCNKLKFSYEKNDVTVNVDSNSLVDETNLNQNPTKIYTGEDIDQVSCELHTLSYISYSSDMNIYTSNKGYMRYEVSGSDSIAQNATFDENGSLVEREAWVNDYHMVGEIKYNNEFDSIDFDKYEKRDDDYISTFSEYLSIFMSLSYVIQ